MKGGRALRLELSRGSSAVDRTGWEPNAAARTNLGSCRLGNIVTWENVFGKTPNSARINNESSKY